MSNDETTIVRYMVSDVGAAVDFYTKHFGFEEWGPSSPAFAAVTRGNLRLLLSGPAELGGPPHAGRCQPGPGGWNRIHFVYPDLDAEIARLRGRRRPVPQRRRHAVPEASRSSSRTRRGNLVELFQPAAVRTPP